MLPRERCDFSAIVDRPPLRLPGGARIVVWTIVNYEVWDIARPMPRQILPAPTGQVLLARRSQLELARIRDAGGCVAVLRAVRAARHPPDARAHARVCEDYPRVAEEARRSDWGIHGPTAMTRCRSTRTTIKSR